MHGFISILSDNLIDKQLFVSWKPDFYFYPKSLEQEIINDDYAVFRKTDFKFISEKLWIDNDELLCVSDGSIINLDNLMQKNGVSNHSDLILSLRKQNEEFFNFFEGSFVGFCYFKKERVWYVFNNHSATKRLYFFHNNDQLIFSTDLFALNNVLKFLKFKTKPNLLASRLMLSSGYVFEDLTPIEGVKKLRAGEYFRYKNNKLERKFYFHLKNIRETSLNKTDLIDALDEKFQKAVTLNFEFGKKENLENWTTISGGLDSRMVALIADKLGYKEQEWFNFSEPNYAEQTIAKQLAKKYRYPLSLYNLQSDSLMPIDEILSVNDGMGIYTGCSHILSALHHLETDKIGLIHTGIMGDTVMGSSANTDKIKIENRLFATKNPNEEAKFYIENLIASYDGNTELAVIYNTIYNNESNGFLYFDLKGQTVSPFLNREFMQLAFSMPEKYKLNRNLYVDWILCKHPEMAKFTWEAIGGRPTNNPTKRNYYRLKRALLKRAPFPNQWKKGMNPEELWYKSNQMLQENLDWYFYQNLERIDDTQLRNETEKRYREGNFDEKARCITVVATYKLFFS